MKGEVKFFNSDKGYGFITKEDGKDIFVHINDVKGKVPLEKNQNVVFDISPGKKGDLAVNVKLIEHADTYPMKDTKISFSENK